MLPSETVDPVVVTDVSADEFSISFRVDRVGSPVLVRTSYFPNWSVSGADGPYRVAPNLMVVVPTDTEVELTYGRSGIEVVSIVLTLLGIAALFLLRRIPEAGGKVLWDLGASPVEQLPTADHLRSEVAAGRADPHVLRQVSADTDRLTRLWSRRVVVAVGAILATLVVQVAAGPSAHEPLFSLIVWLPGIVGAVALVTSLGPALVRLLVYRSTVVGPAHLLAAGIAGAGESTAPAPEPDPAD